MTLVLLSLASVLLRGSVFGAHTPPFTSAYPATSATILLLRVATPTLMIAAFLSVGFWHPRRLNLLISAIFAVFAVSGFQVQSLLAITPFLMTLYLGSLLHDNLRLRQLIYHLFLSAIVLSILCAPLFPWAVRGQRLQGLFANPNGLAAASFFLLIMALQRSSWPGVVLSLYSLVSTGNRAFLIASALALVMIMFSKPDHRGPAAWLKAWRAPIIFLTVASGLFLGSGRLFEDRTTSGRTELWREALETGHISLPWGIGYSASEVEWANSFFFVYVELGVLGAVAGMCAYGFLARQVAKLRGEGNVIASAAIAGAMVSSLVEGWLFASGSFLAVTFWLSWAWTTTGARS